MFERMAVLEQQSAHQRTLIGSLRKGLRAALQVIEHAAPPAELHTRGWYRQAKQALNVGLDDAADTDYQPCPHCGVPGGH